MDMNESWEKMLEEVAADEGWLASFPAPVPDKAVVEKLKVRLREEARAVKAPRRRPFRPWQGAMVSAAALAFCATVAWYSGRGQEASTPTHPAAVQPTVAWTMPPSSKPEVITEMDDELDELESQWADEPSWALSGASLYQSMEEALSDETQPTQG